MASERVDVGNIARRALDHNLWIGAPEGRAILALLNPPEGTRLVLMSDELMDALARPREGFTVTWQWGEPDDHGWYTPTFTEHAAEVSDGK